MATDLEKLVVQLSADITQYQRGLQNAMGVTNRQARAIESRWKQSEKNLNAIGSNMARGLIAPLAGIAAALTAKEVLTYADAWTKAKNSLAVAGITGAKQAVVLERLFQSAQANATPIGALSDLFGKAAQASDNLGASTEQLIQFSDGVAVALKVAGTGAAEASGALTQLGQLLGFARVQAEEFNSVNEGARPILIAVANGLDAAGGSVNRLKQLVDDGKVSGQQFFQAFLKGLPTIQAMAANSTQTIEQGVTKVTNAFTKYIGQTDESLGASQRLAVGLNALADNFEKTADVVLQVASIIAGALVGRALGGMIAQLPLAATALVRFAAALRAAATTSAVVTAIGGVAAAAGPIGLIVGGTAVAALTLFAATAGKASDGARGYAEALRQVEAAAKGSSSAVAGTSGSLTAATINNLLKSISAGKDDIKSALADINASFTAAFDAERVKDFVGLGFMSEKQRSDLEELRDKLNTGAVTAEEVKNALYALANSNPAFQKLADGFAPLLERLGLASKAVSNLKGQLDTLSAPEIQMEGATAAFLKMRETGQAFIKDAERRAALTKDQYELEKQIAEIQARAQKAGATLTTSQATDLAKKELAAEERRKAEGKKTPLDANYRLDEDVTQIQNRIAALKLEQETMGLSTAEQEKRRVALDLEQQALAQLRKEAQQKGVEDLDSIHLSDEQRAKIEAVAEAYGKQAAATEEARNKLQRMHDLQQELGNLGIDAITGLADGTKNLNDVLQDTLKLLVNLILKAALLGDGPLGNGGGGLIGSLFKGAGFAEGGYTGDGGKHDPAGVVHRGEYVFDKAATSKIGVRNLEALRRGRGFAEGGFVGPAGFSIPKITPVGGTSSLTLAPSYTIDARGSQMTEAQFAGLLKENNRMLLQQVPGVVDKARRRQFASQRT